MRTIRALALGALVGATGLAPAAPAVDHCDFVGVVTDQVPPPDSPFDPPVSVPDSARSITLLQTCRIRTNDGLNNSTQIEDRNPVLDLAGDDITILREALGGATAPPDENVGLP